MNSSAAAFSSPIVDGMGPIVSDTTALVFISAGNKTPVGPMGLEAGGGKREGGSVRGSGKREAGSEAESTGTSHLCHWRVPLPPSPFPLFYIPAEVKLAARQGDDAVETCLHFRWKIAPCHQALSLRANRFLRLHEVSLFQFAGVVVCHKGLGQWYEVWCQADVS